MKRIISSRPTMGRKRRAMDASREMMRDTDRMFEEQSWLGHNRQ